MICAYTFADFAFIGHKRLRFFENIPYITIKWGWEVRWGCLGEGREVWVGGVVQLILPICKKLPGGGGGVSG